MGDSSTPSMNTRLQVNKRNAPESRTQQAGLHQPSTSRETGVSLHMQFELHQKAMMDQAISRFISSLQTPLANTPQDKIIIDRYPFHERIVKVMHFYLKNYNYWFDTESLTCLFYFKPDLRDSIREICNFSKETNKIQIIVLFTEVYSRERRKRLPYNLSVAVNGQECELPQMNYNYNTRPYRNNVPVEITNQIILKNRSWNELQIDWSDDPNDFRATIYVINKLTTDELLVKVKEKPKRHYERTRQLIKQSMESDTDMVVSSMCSTLQDPLSKTRMKLPVRGVLCIHLQCFDGIQYIKLNNQKPTWLCPLCKRYIKWADIEVDEFFLHILQSPNLSKECENVILFKDGSWSEEKRMFSNSSGSNSSSNNEIIELTLSDSDDDDDDRHVNPTYSSKSGQEEICVITLD